MSGSVRKPEPLVSIVTPVHNEEPYLAECLESVLAQTYERWTMTIVNNGSTDRSLEIARDYATQDERIRVHDNEVFLPQVENINQAVRRISPESAFCQMVLGDDWLFPNSLAEMVRVGQSSDRIALVCAYIATEDDVVNTGLPRDREVFSGRKVCASQLLTGRFYFGSPTSQLWRADIVRAREPFFRTDFHGDSDACYDVLQSWDFGFVHEILTFRRTRNDSITKRVSGFASEFVDGVVMVTNYGERYLDPVSFAQRYRPMLREYELFLGECAVRGQGEAFWEHHRQAGEAMHRPLTRWRRAWLGARWLADSVLNPKRTVGRLIAKVGRDGLPPLVDPVSGRTIPGLRP